MRSYEWRSALGGLVSLGVEMACEADADADRVVGVWCGDKRRKCCIGDV